MVADHEHVQMLLDGVYREGPGRIRGAGEHVGLGGNLDDVRRMPAAGAFRVEGVYRAPADGANCVFHEAGFIEGIGVNGGLNVVFVADVQAGVDYRRGRAQSSCIFKPQAPASICSRSPSGRLLLPLPKKPTLTTNSSALWYMRPIFHGPGVQVVAVVPAAGPVPPAAMA